MASLPPTITFQPDGETPLLFEERDGEDIGDPDIVRGQMIQLEQIRRLEPHSSKSEYFINENNIRHEEIWTDQIPPEVMSTEEIIQSENEYSANILRPWLEDTACLITGPGVSKRNAVQGSQEQFTGEKGKWKDTDGHFRNKNFDREVLTDKFYKPYEVFSSPPIIPFVQVVPCETQGLYKEMAGEDLSHGDRVKEYKMSSYGKDSKVPHLSNLKETMKNDGDIKGTYNEMIHSEKEALSNILRPGLCDTPCHLEVQGRNQRYAVQGSRVSNLINMFEESGKGENWD